MNYWNGCFKKERISMNDSALKRTKRIIAIVTEFGRINNSGIEMIYVFCEYWENEQLYIFESVPTPYNLQLAVGDTIEVFIAPDDYSNYYVSINNCAIDRDVEFHRCEGDVGEKEVNTWQNILGSDEKEVNLTIVRCACILLALFVWFLGVKHYINIFESTILTIVLVVLLTRVESKIAGKGNTSISIREREIYEIFCVHKYVYYFYFIMLNLYSVYLCLFKEKMGDDCVLFALFTFLVDLAVVYFVIREKHSKK